MPRTHLTVTLTLRAPVLTHSSAPEAYGIDAPAARAATGRCCLPGSLVKGRLLESWLELKDALADPDVIAAQVHDWLGSKSAKGGNDRPHRALLRFTDFECLTAESRGVRYRIHIDPERGSVLTGQYLVMESPFRPGQEVEFQGGIEFVATPEEADRIQRDVTIGLNWITSFGSQRTSGFGELLKVEVARHDAEAPAPPPLTSAERLTLAIRPRAPFCLAGRRISGNTFESETIIAGSVIKGCVASLLQSLSGKRGEQTSGAVTAGTDPERRELCANLSRIRFAHAFPVPEPGIARPVEPPLSLVRAGSRLVDVALCPGPGLIDGEAPAFAPDWKNDYDVRELFGWGDPGRSLRVRTAIDRLTGRAEDEQLFAYRMVLPDGFVWSAAVDFSAIEDEGERAAAARQLAQLLAVHGVPGIGKTKAPAAVVAGAAGALPPVAPIDGKFVLTLQTPALLLDARTFTEASRERELEAAYKSYWEQASGGSLCLRSYFARQVLAGGEYLRRRFQLARPYHPYSLTVEGSVFVLEAVDPALASAHIESWRRRGLPLRPWAIDHSPDAPWRTCPYDPANGFGEIAVNLSCHWDMFPKEAFDAICIALAD